ncbi:unnamed protein product [Phytophthora fragariaefolia]|uniref:Unnamed protein product n=1 Tax=Phytophthora fragariaefolia TaxID=1490495 RepID=A0A9W7CR09_9STRA|nr:unnamed protein product [Phytophthora fragariaefolia]
MVRIIEAHDKVTLLDAKETLRREFEVIKKREEKEQAFKASTRERSGRGGRGREAGSRRGDRSVGGGGRAKQARAAQAADYSKHGGDSMPWHARLGHVSAPKMFGMAKMCDGLPSLAREDDSAGGVCGCCAQGKMPTSRFARKTGSEVKPRCLVDVVHTDGMGPMKPKSKGGALYVLTFIDDYSRLVYPYLLTLKAHVFDWFRKFKALAKMQTGYKLKCIRSDNGGEYISKRFNQLCASSVVEHQTSALYSPQQNGLAERMNRTITEMARSMIHYMEVDQQWWGEAVLTAAHIINRIPNTARRDKTPLEALTSVQPSLDYRRRLVKTRTVTLDESPAARCRDVVFIDNGRGSSSPSVFVDADEEWSVPHRPSAPVPPATDMEVDETEDQSVDMEVEPGSITVVSLAAGSSLMEPDASTSSSVTLRRRPAANLLSAPSPSQALATPDLTRYLPFSENPIVYRGVPDLPGNAADILLLANEPHMNVQDEDEVGEPDLKRPRLDEYEIALAATDVPGSYREAMSSSEAKQWKEAIRKEIRSQVRNRTWDLVKHPHGVKVIDSKWVFAHKFDEYGNSVRYKARLVALGCLQTRGVDYYYTYSPVANTNTIRVFLVACAHATSSTNPLIPSLRTCTYLKPLMLSIMVRKSKCNTLLGRVARNVSPNGRGIRPPAATMQCRHSFTNVVTSGPIVGQKKHVSSALSVVAAPR